MGDSYYAWWEPTHLIVKGLLASGMPAGGSFAYADPEVRLSVAVTHNKMLYVNPGELGRANIICDLIRKGLGRGLTALDKMGCFF